MQTRIEPLYKAPDKIEFGWNPEPGDVASYNVYVGLTESTLVKIEEGVSSRSSKLGRYLGKIAYVATIEEVRALLGLSSDIDFSNKVLYWTITTVDSSGTESALVDSTVITVYPTGIDPKLQRDDHTIDRHIYGFSDDLYRWIKVSASSSGALVVDNSDFYKSNITTEYSYDGTNVSSTLSYPSDQTSSGSPAKLTTYEYSGSQVTKVTTTDSTVP